MMSSRNIYTHLCLAIKFADFFIRETQLTQTIVCPPLSASFRAIRAETRNSYLFQLSPALPQDASNLLVAISGSVHQGGPSVVALSAHDGARLKQYPSNLLVAILGSDHQGGPSGVALSAHDGARLKQYPSNLLVAI